MADGSADELEREENATSVSLVVGGRSRASSRLATSPTLDVAPSQSEPILRTHAPLTIPSASRTVHPNDSATDTTKNAIDRPHVSNERLPWEKWLEPKCGLDVPKKDLMSTLGQGTEREGDKTIYHDRVR